MTDSFGMSRGGLKQPAAAAANKQRNNSVRMRACFMTWRSVDIAGSADEAWIAGSRRVDAASALEAVFDIRTGRRQRIERRAQLRGIGRLDQIRRHHDDQLGLVVQIVRGREQL